MIKSNDDIGFVLIEIDNRVAKGGSYDWLDISRHLAEFGFNRSKVLYACYDGPWAPTYLDVVFWRHSAE